MTDRNTTIATTETAARTAGATTATIRNVVDRGARSTGVFEFVVGRDTYVRDITVDDWAELEGAMKADVVATVAKHGGRG